MPSRKMQNAPRAGSILPQRNRRKVSYKVTGYRSVVDPVLVDATSLSPSLVAANTNGVGATAGAAALNTLGLQATSSGAAPSNVTVDTPHLPWLYSTARNFEEFRVTRAVLTVVGLQLGSTTQGTMSLMSSTDYVDAAIAAPTVGGLITGGAQFQLADLANRNYNMPLDVDTAWKKVSKVASLVSGTTILPVSSFDDLCFSNFTYAISNGPISVPVCTFYVTYDVEFRRPVSFTINN